MTAVNPVYMSPDLASVIEIRVGATNSPVDIERIAVRWREGLKAIPDHMCRSAHADSIFGVARSLVLDSAWEHIGQYAFSEWVSATTITLPEGLTSVGPYAFQRWLSAAAGLTIPSSLTNMGTGAFFGWSSATEFRLAPGHTGQGVGGTSVNGALLRDWASLKKIELPDTVLSLGGHLTHNAVTQLEVIIVRAATPPAITSTTFTGIPDGARFYVPDGSVEAYKSAPQWVTYADRILPLSALP